jgi:tetratricopeptide (TPR) repeat protein
MFTPRPSRHRRSGEQMDVANRLAALLRVLTGGGTSHRHRRTSSRHKHRHGGSRNELLVGSGESLFFVRRQISRARLVGITVLAVGSIWLGWRIIANAAAQNFALSSPDTALRWMPNASVALNQMAQQELVDPDADLRAAQRWAQRALRSRPLDDRAVFLLGVIAQRNGDKQKAAALMNIAGERTWRDLGTQIWLFENEVRRGDFTHALEHADAMLRVDPHFDTQLFPTLAAFTAVPPAFQALVHILETDPPWRSWYLTQASSRLANQARLDELYTLLMKSKAPPSKDELHPYLNRLLKDGRFPEAYKIWLSTLTPAEMPNGKYPYNRDFSFPIDGLPFNWDLTSIPGADVRIISTDAGRKHALRVQFSGARVSFENVRQVMMLAPGNYRFEGQVKAEDLQTARGLWWRIYCAEKPGKTLGQSKLVSGTTPWTPFSLDFEVPANNCTAQWLQLELPARIASEHKIEGQVWYEFLRINPVPIRPSSSK